MLGETHRGLRVLLGRDPFVMSAETIISVEDLGKSYVIRHQTGAPGYRRLSEEIVEAVTRPFRALGRRGATEVALVEDSAPPSREHFWALKGVSFDVKCGDVLGVIGRNGAGKSTLLKILSRITEPTEGRVRIRGRVASLLEVGTGFHPELTGRENIFLNGTILGMTRREIQKKFDEIVAFAEVDKFLDTPVKRYSSGMYVRLAFAVAAHLEPEILIVDEVLAVGDVQFQRKCLGKMKDVAGQGRTVLFVSHNMAAVQSLTNRCILLSQGRVVAAGGTDEVVAGYLKGPDIKQGASPEVKRRHTGRHSSIVSVGFPSTGGGKFLVYTPGVPISIGLRIRTDGWPNLSIDVFLKAPMEQKLALFSTNHFYHLTLPATAGTYDCLLELEGLRLASGQYRLDVCTSNTNVAYEDFLEDALVIDVPVCNPTSGDWDYSAALGYGNIAWLCLGAPHFSRVEGGGAD